MNRLSPEMAAGLCIRTERHGEVRELDVAPSQNAKRQRRRISKRWDAAIARDECGAGDHKPAGDSGAELGAAHHPIGADHAVRHEDVVCVGPPGGGIVLVYRALRMPKSEVSIFIAASNRVVPRRSSTSNDHLPRIS